jgi:hypothetical protein
VEFLIGIFIYASINDKQKYFPLGIRNWGSRTPKGVVSLSDKVCQ